MRVRVCTLCKCALALCEVALLVGVPASAVAQSGEARPKTVHVVRTAKPPLIDGRLDDQAWTQAEAIEDLHEIRPNEFDPPSQRTQIYVLYDSDALYVGARMWETDPSLITARILKQREFLQGEDHFGVILDPFNNHRSGYTFIVSPNGVRVDGIFQNVTTSQWDWDGIYVGAAARFEQGWTAELMIPFKTLSFDPKNDTWGINFFRHIARDTNHIGWVSRNRSQNPSITGEAVGLNGLRQGLGLDVVPSVSVNQHDAQPALDVFYKITPALNSSVTVNTDFSSTEVDDRQVNLTRFNLFFPEKRTFFLRDLDIFEFGGSAAFNNTMNTAATPASVQNARPFFSRSIGLSAAGQPVALDVGGKLSGRIGRWDVGALMVRQDRDGAIDVSNLFVGRVTRSVLSGSKVGVIASNGDPRSNLRSSLLGGDFQYLNSRVRGNHTVQGEVWFQHSDGNGPRARGHAFGAGLHVPNQAGWRGEVAVKQVDASFNPALGFVSSHGVRAITSDLGYTYRPRSSYLTSIFGGVDLYRTDLVGGGLESQIVSVRLIELQNGMSDQLLARYILDKEILLQPFPIARGVTIPAGAYAFNQALLQFDSGLQRRVAGGVTYRSGAFYGGDRTDLGARVTLRPSKHVREALSYAITDARLPYGHFVTRLVTSKTDLVLSNAISWVNLIQYDNVSNVIGINSRLHWTPRDGREVFLVLNQNYQDVDQRGVFRSVYTDTVVKVNYTFRF